MNVRRSSAPAQSAAGAGLAGAVGRHALPGAYDDWRASELQRIINIDSFHSP
jgi:hypothetical protein